MWTQSDRVELFWGPLAGSYSWHPNKCSHEQIFFLSFNNIPPLKQKPFSSLALVFFRYTVTDVPFHNTKQQVRIAVRFFFFHTEILTTVGL